MIRNLTQLRSDTGTFQIAQKIRTEIMEDGDAM